MTAVFLGSYAASQDLPKRTEPKIAFLGRSNVGKSSLINLISRSEVARISKTPGRTRILNLYLVNDRMIFGDFPGYGFAKVSKKERDQWKYLIEKFLRAEYFHFAIQIIDARHPGLEMDLQLHQWLQHRRLPHLIVLNKTDKLNQKQKVEAEREAQKAFPNQPLLFASSFSKEGKRELEKILHKISEEQYQESL